MVPWTAQSVRLLSGISDGLQRQRQGRRSVPVGETPAGVAKTDIAVTPLAMPMLSGPGAISTAIMLHNQAAGLGQRVALYLCIGAVCLDSST